jgi:arsenate reductase (thioredoxin)
MILLHDLVPGRRTVLIGGLVLAVTGASAPPPRVLFICQAGTAKSAIAREFFRRRARERRVSVTAFSRGLTIDDHISASLQKSLYDEGINPAHDRAVRLTRRDLRAADIIVFFNPLPVALGPVTAQDWTALPSVNDNWPLARTDLMLRIDALLDEIARMRQ